MDLLPDNLCAWVPYVAPKRVSVGEAELDSAFAPVLAMGCTDRRCPNTVTPPRAAGPLCLRCEAIARFNKLDRREAT